MATIAIIEDNKELRDGFQTLFNHTNGLDCIATFESVESATADNWNIIPDIIFTDIGLPGLSGIDGIKILKQKFPITLFMVYTVFDNDDKVFEALKAGANSYILKKESPTKVVDAIFELLDGGAPMSTSIARKVMESFHETTSMKVLFPLSTREIEILTLLSKGYQNKEIAEQMFISAGTVKVHIHHIYEKLHVQNRVEAVNKFKNL